MIQRSMTAEEFVERRIELPDGGQWSELIRGVPVSLDPPDIDHGTIVLNLSKAFSSYVHATLNGYPCFDLGLQVERSPDTVYFPSVSYFLEGPRFAEADREVTKTVPALVVELATTKDRRNQVSERIHAYQRHGVQAVWLADPMMRTVHVCMRNRKGHDRLDESDRLSGGLILPGFEIQVADLFTPPDWAQT
ncbi:Uma2 family endonuclease [Planctomicrobium sp. SH661]|uniref:Uma2 family endonuclease n=1 Tax=Planctomicrobium sp. SH661 TaxID=3448124 RepID=UPI003F5C74B9